MVGEAKQLESGLALIEGAMICMLLLGLLIGSLALWDYVHTKATMIKVLDETLSSSSVKPFSLSVQDNGTFEIRVKSSEIKREIERLVDQSSKSLINSISALRDSENSSNSFYIEGCYTVLRINKDKGSFEGVSEYVCPKEAGDRRAASGSSSDQTMAFLFERHVNTQAAPGVSLAAFPDGSGQSKFLQYSVLIGIREFVKVEKGASSLASDFFHRDPFLFHAQVNSLRGEF